MDRMGGSLHFRDRPQELLGAWRSMAKLRRGTIDGDPSMVDGGFHWFPGRLIDG